MTISISTFGTQLFTTSNLQNQQSLLAELNQQLASNQQHSNLTDYAPADAHNLIDFQNAITQRQSYIAGMKTVNTRLTVYDSTMTDMEKIAAQAQSLASQNQTYDPSKVAQLQAQAKVFLQQIQDDLNQKVGGRYIYAGSRYSTSPVADLTTLAAPTLPFTPSVSPNLPDYDSEYSPPGTTTDAAAFAKDSVTVDSNFNLQYGVTSNDPGFQNMIAGLRLLNAATSQSDPTVYTNDLIAAGTLLSTGITGIQSTHAGVAGNINILTQETQTQNTDITNLQNQIGNIQNVDVSQIGITINLLQTQLQASYSATAALIQESILKFL